MIKFDNETEYYSNPQLLAIGYRKRIIPFLINKLKYIKKDNEKYYFTNYINFNLLSTMKDQYTISLLILHCV